MHGALWHMQAWQSTHCLVTFQQWNYKHEVSLMIQVVHNVPALQVDEIITHYQSQLSRNHGIVSFFAGLRWRQLIDLLTKVTGLTKSLVYSFFQSSCHLKFSLKSKYNKGSVNWFFFEIVLLGTAYAFT